MNICLQGFRNSSHYKKNLNGFITLGDMSLNDLEVRIVINKGIEAGYKYLHDIPDKIAEKWLKDK